MERLDRCGVSDRDWQSAEAEAAWLPHDLVPRLDPYRVGHDAFNVFAGPLAPKTREGVPPGPTISHGPAGKERATLLRVDFSVKINDRGRPHVKPGGNRMNINRRTLTSSLPIIGLLALSLQRTSAANATSADEETLAKRLEAFRAAQASANAKGLGELCAPELSYSHSDGHVEDKATFIKNATAATSKYLSLVYQDPWLRVVGDDAIVRFHWLGESETVPEGKKSSTNLHILMNWQKQHGEWLLLSRASTKL